MRQALLEVGSSLQFGPPKTASGEDRVVDLDDTTVGALLTHRLDQEAERALAGAAYRDLDLVFARPDGSPTPPGYVTAAFRRLIDKVRFPEDAHLPDADRRRLRHVRLHDLRHGQASLMLAAGVPLAVVSKRLGHSTVAITADTYSHLLEGVGRDAANRAAALVERQGGSNVSPRTPGPVELAAARGSSGGRDAVAAQLRDHPVITEAIQGASGHWSYDETPGQGGGPPGDRTQNPRIKSPLLCQLS